MKIDIGKGYGDLFSPLLPTVDTTSVLNAEVGGANLQTMDSLNKQLASSTSSSGGNMLAGNFVQQNYERSRYIDAAMISHQVENEFATKLMGIVSKGQAQSDATDNYAEKVLSGKRAARAAEQAVEAYYSEKMNEKLEKQREETEEERQEELENPESTEPAEGAGSAETTAAADSTENVDTGEGTDIPAGEASGMNGVAEESGSIASTAENAAPDQAIRVGITEAVPGTYIDTIV